MSHVGIQSVAGDEARGRNNPKTLRKSRQNAYDDDDEDDDYHYSVYDE